MAERQVLIVNEASFDREVLQHSRPVVVDFSSRTCGACAKYDPEFARALDQDFTGTKFAKVLAQEAPALFSRYQVAATPTTILFRGGVEIARQQGALSGYELLSWMRRNVAEAA